MQCLEDLKLDLSPFHALNMYFRIDLSPQFKKTFHNWVNFAIHFKMG